MEQTVLPYPKWWLDRAAERKALLDSAVERLAVHCARNPTIVEALVFGSHALGRVGPKSDLDVMIVQESNASQSTRTAKLYVELTDALDMAIDLIVYTPEEFRRLSKTRNFVIEAVAHGQRIYARTSA
ncbi:MAG: nucleotidyltransferase domain-containing protein [Candidatus Eremiobacteraeota bacterium]|nr:nucleotidyltransferase domain-containing protein [Candidatus Eremiobacteraeota bacterium]